MIVRAAGFLARHARRLAKRLSVSLAADPYAAKEDYVAAHADVAWWDAHLNGTLVRDYAARLSGPLADFGCNHGAVSILLARQGFEVCGIDLNAAAVAEALKLAAQEPPELRARLRYLCSRFDKLDLPDACFGGGIMFDVIEHIYEKDRQAMFSEIRRVLKPGGRLLIATPFEHAYDDGVQHVAFFDEGSLRAVLEGLGFKVLELARDRRPDAHTPQGHDRLNALVERTPG